MHGVSDVYKWNKALRQGIIQLHVPRTCNKLYQGNHLQSALNDYSNDKYPPDRRATGELRIYQTSNRTGQLHEWLCGSAYCH